MNNEKEILRKLLAIANSQQKVIRKMAASVGLPPADPYPAYLKGAVDTAATNAGITFPIGADVTPIPAPKQQPGVKMEGTYNVNMRGFEKADNKTKENFTRVYLNQVKAQKPELESRVSVFFS